MLYVVYVCGRTLCQAHHGITAPFDSDADLDGRAYIISEIVMVVTEARTG